MVGIMARTTGLLGLLGANFLRPPCPTIRSSSKGGFLGEQRVHHDDLIAYFLSKTTGLLGLLGPKFLRFAHLPNNKVLT